MKNVHALEQKTMQLLHGHTAQKESLIKAAIEHCIGKDWTIADIIGRGEFIIQPDKTEIFSFDGRELIHFTTRIEVDNSRNGVFVSAVTEYRLLYT